MTVFQPISANGAGHEFRPADAVAPGLRRKDRIVVINSQGECTGKLGEKLGELGYDAAYLRQELDAIAELNSWAETVSIIILDWRYEGAKDWMFADALADKATEIGLPVLTLTIADHAEDVRIASEAGLSTILSMPCRLADLKRALDCLGRRARRVKAAAGLGLGEAVMLLESCKFRFRTPEDVETLLPIVAKLFPDPERSVAGLAELMLNAIEHGNLEVGHERKAEWVARGVYQSELAKRLQTPPFSNRWAELIVNRREDGIMIVIMDEGCGFCWQDLIRGAGANETGAIARPCGDGLSRARLESFDDVRFNHIGNQVTAFVADGSHDGERF
ncbi:MAG: hypothetical protein ACFCUR_15330 [Rhodomicrobiaceae bacterium]